MQISLQLEYICTNVKNKTNEKQMGQNKCQYSWQNWLKSAEYRVIYIEIIQT